MSVVDTYQYEDPQDVFSREPFILRVSVPSTSKQGDKWPRAVAWGGCGADIPLPWQRWRSLCWCRCIQPHVMLSPRSMHSTMSTWPLSASGGLM